MNPLVPCSKCGNSGEPKSSVQTAPGRWLCGECWRKSSGGRAAALTRRWGKYCNCNSNSNSNPKEAP